MNNKDRVQLAYDESSNQYYFFFDFFLKGRFDKDQLHMAIRHLDQIRAKLYKEEITSAYDIPFHATSEVEKQNMQFSGSKLEEILVNMEEDHRELCRKVYGKDYTELEEAYSFIIQGKKMDEAMMTADDFFNYMEE